MRGGLGVYKKYPDRKPELVAEVRDKVIFGSAQAANVHVQDLRVSGIHAIIEKDEKGNPVLIDLGSRFGTYHNKKRIDEVNLKEGDRFEIGRQTFIIDKMTEKFVEPKVDHQKSPKSQSESKPLELASEKNLLEVTLYWGEKPLEVKTFEAGSIITLGTQRKTTFPVTFSARELQAAPYKIAEYKNGSLCIKIPLEASGLLWSGKEIISLDALRHRDKAKTEFGDIEVNLRVGDKVHIHFGEMALFFRFVSPNEKADVLAIPKPDRVLLKSALIVGLICLFLFLALTFIKLPEKEETLDDIPEHLKQVLYDAGIEEALQKQQSAIGQIAKTLDGGRARSEEGRASAKQTPQKPVEQKPATQQEQTTQTETPAPALDLDAAFNVSSETKEVKKVDVVGAVNNGNTAATVLDGGFARGTKGLGAGGGGQSVGIGALKGYSTGGGMGAQDFGLAPSKGRAIKNPAEQEVVILGGLDPDIIAEIIKRYLPQIQNCYEQQLTLKPNLKGKVTMSFIIGPNGTVKKATIAETTLHDTATEKCITDRVMTWVFPKPKGGGTVGVKYPFLLMSNAGK